MHNSETTTCCTAESTTCCTANLKTAGLTVIAGLGICEEPMSTCLSAYLLSSPHSLISLPILVCPPSQSLPGSSESAIICFVSLGRSFAGLLIPKTVVLNQVLPAGSGTALVFQQLSPTFTRRQSSSSLYHNSSEICSCGGQC